MPDTAHFSEAITDTETYKRLLKHFKQLYSIFETFKPCNTPVKRESWIQMQQKSNNWSEKK